MKHPITTRSRSAAMKPDERSDHVAAADGSVHLVLRRRQRIVVQPGGPDHLFTIESGCLALDAILPRDRRQVALILFPGDGITRASMPPAPRIGLTAMVPSIVGRRRLDDAPTAEAAAIASPHNLVGSANRNAARAALHAIAIGRLTGEERVATLFLELALNLGKTTPIGISFDVPLSRNDMADYLALNPDTLSRLVSRMRASGVLSMPARSRGVVKDLAALATLTPLAQALQALAGGLAPAA